MPKSQTLETQEYVTLHGIKAADGIKFANQLILKYRDYHGLSKWAQYNHKNP